VHGPGAAHRVVRELCVLRDGKSALWKKRFSPGPPPGKGVALQPPPGELQPISELPVTGAPLCPAFGRLRGWYGLGRFPATTSTARPGAAGAGREGAKSQEGAFGGKLTEASEPAAAAGRGVRTCLVASVCFWAAENCWAESSAAPPKGQPGIWGS
jgi:hypothetical protein